MDIAKLLIMLSYLFCHSKMNKLRDVQNRAHPNLGYNRIRAVHCRSFRLSIAKLEPRGRQYKPMGRDMLLM